jgi:hypothetical protein
MTCAKQESNKILLQGRNKNKTKQWQEYVYKTNVEQIESHNKLYIHIYLLST